ncbi:hypothetical protein EYZ11_006409 [Aspergillus tanneri]|uniref:T6SS Phospholipase effector Tle1-like catalytic domain-containing protein n=1 Tax=Aspergillus tanneri TaxID=1220188 RepID=A0A4S3JFZ1_9EURO|nr:hypothetical protein EYZ11_006409 [Aspergillus tanneri]
MPDPCDCESPPTELVLCFDGTGNTFRADGAESNVLKIFSMLDRKKGNRFCYYQPGIGTDITPSSFTNVALRPLPTHKVFDSALATSFDQHVIGGYRFLARRWVAGARIYLFGFSRGAYTARFLNEMLDFVGLLSADNEELIPFVWQAFTAWKFASPGKEREDAEASLRISRDTLCRSIGWVHFLGLFDTVNSVAEFNWDFTKSNPIQPNPRTMRHAVSIDERRIKFQPVLFQEVRGRCGETHIPRVSTWAARSEPDLLSQVPFPLNPDFEEVYFAGDHCDVGGGWPIDKWATHRWPVSQIPLMWMVQEAALAGLTFDHDHLKRHGCHDPFAEDYDSEIVRTAESAPLHDSLNYSDPGKTVETLFWRVLECMPFKRAKVAPDGSVQDSRWHMPGLRRPLPNGAKIHGSVINRLRNDPDYRPYNLGLGNKPNTMHRRAEYREIGRWRMVEDETSLNSSRKGSRKTSPIAQFTGLRDYYFRVLETDPTIDDNQDREQRKQEQEQGPSDDAQDD